MFDKQIMKKPSSIVALIVMLLGVFISGVDFANFVSDYGFSFMFLLGLILIIAGVYFLNKKKVFVVNKKSIINLIVFLFTFGSAFFIVRGLINIISISYTPLDFITLSLGFLLRISYWKSLLAKLIFIGGLIYLIVANKPEEKLLLEEKVQLKEKETPVEPKKDHMSVGKWFWTIFLLGIPIVNLILLLVWGFGAPSPRKNFSLAILLYMLISAVVILLTIVIAQASGARIY